MSRIYVNSDSADEYCPSCNLFCDLRNLAQTTLVSTIDWNLSTSNRNNARNFFGANVTCQGRNNHVSPWDGSSSLDADGSVAGAANGRAHTKEFQNNCRRHGSVESDVARRQ